MPMLCANTVLLCTCALTYRGLAKLNFGSGWKTITMMELRILLTVPPCTIGRAPQRKPQNPAGIVVVTMMLVKAIHCFQGVHRNLATVPPLPAAVEYEGFQTGDVPALDRKHVRKISGVGAAGQNMDRVKGALEGVSPEHVFRCC